MRIIRFLIYYAMVTTLGLMALLFLGLNHFTVQLDLIETQYSVSVAWVMVGAAAFGFVIALLVLLPGRIAAGLYARALARDVRALNDDLRDLEYALDEQDEQRALLVEQHELLLERHERMLLRHQSLVSDHSQVVAERNEVRAQLAALRIARPAAVSHGSAVATALRLVPQAQPPSPAPAVAQPAPVPVARVEAAPAPVQHPITPITPGPWPGVAPVAPVAPVEPEPATVPVVSSPPAPVVAKAATPPATPAKPATPASAPVTPRVKGPGVWTRLQTRARRSWQATATWTRDAGQRASQRGGEAWGALSVTVSAQSKTQFARLQALQQRLTQRLMALRNDAE